MRACVASILIFGLAMHGRAEDFALYRAKYAGGSIPVLRTGNEVDLQLEADAVLVRKSGAKGTRISAANITEISYGQEAHRRIGTAVGLAIVSFGIGALTAFSKSKQHFIGITWADGDKRGGIVVQASKHDFRGLLAALEGMSGKKAVNADDQNRVP
jgi:hypothetical protein